VDDLLLQIGQSRSKIVSSIDSAERVFATSIAWKRHIPTVEETRRVRPVEVRSGGAG